MPYWGHWSPLWGYDALQGPQGPYPHMDSRKKKDLSMLLVIALHIVYATISALTGGTML